jgi:autotransporter adhesin
MSVAIGNAAIATGSNNVSLGAYSNDNGATSAPMVTNTLAGATLTYAGGSNAVGIVSIGDASTNATRVLTNVAPGELSATSVDAVNGSQLYATNTTVDAIYNSEPSITSGTSGIMYFHANGILVDSTASGTMSVAIGNNAVSSTDNAIAIGANANASTVNSVALGANSVTGTATPVAGYAGSAPVGVVSVGDQGSERQITNVAAGQINALSTDAINGSELFALGTSVASIFGGNATYTDGGTFLNPTYTISGTDYNDVGSALEALQNSTTSAIGAIDYQFTTPNTPYVSGTNSAALASASALGDYNLAAGYSAVASGSYALALGAGAQALNDNSEIGRASCRERV